MPHRLLFSAVLLAASLSTLVLRANDALAPPVQAELQPPVQAAPVKDYSACLDYQCKLVPEQKPIKKIVYECREVPFCLHVLPKFGHCDSCPECGCVRYKKVLVKKEIIVGYECLTKCVPEVLPPCGPSKGVPQAPAPVTREYYNGGDLTNLPQAAIPAPPVPAAAPSFKLR
jgi:hypothetical protein